MYSSILMIISHSVVVLVGGTTQDYTFPFHSMLVLFNARLQNTDYDGCLILKLNLKCIFEE